MRNIYRYFVGGHEIKEIDKCMCGGGGLHGAYTTKQNIGKKLIEDDI